MSHIGPETPHAINLHSEKYRDAGETYDDYCVRYARSTANNERHFRRLLDGLREQRILPAGRQQLAVGRAHRITAFNCFVGNTIDDSSEAIFEELKNSMLTLRTGGGCGWDFSTLRPFGDPIRGLGFKAYATGPVSFMGCWDSMCGTVLSAGHRRGAMMGVLRVDHPDIMRFINAKQDQSTLTNFNISVAITDSFMAALAEDGLYDLVFEGRVYDTLSARAVWDRIMERNWDWAEPGVLFIDTINKMNPLGYCEKIHATNPCGEQPLPPHGACLLGSINIPKYLVPRFNDSAIRAVDSNCAYDLDFSQIREDVRTAVMAFDRVIDITYYPLPQYKEEALAKRRMGIGPTGMANALEIMGLPYGSEDYIGMQEKILEVIRDEAYETSTDLAEEYGSFPLFDAEKWLSSGFGETLPDYIQEKIRSKGLRNGLLLSIAPTGTISLCADNVSSGIEPPFALNQKRLINMESGQQEVELTDYAYREYGVSGRTANDVTASQHVAVLCSAQTYVDSAVSKTCNVQGQVAGQGDGISFSDFCRLYLDAYTGGAKGCTTFNVNGKRASILTASEEPEDKAADDGAACFYDPDTGMRECDA